jgi:hypothetical protein
MQQGQQREIRLIILLCPAVTILKAQRVEKHLPAVAQLVEAVVVTH